MRRRRSLALANVSLSRASRRPASGGTTGRTHRTAPTSSTARAAGLSVALLWLSATGVGAAAQESAAFVVTLGTDTITVERFSRDSVSIWGEILTRYYVPATVHIRYRGILDSYGNVRQLNVSARPARPRDSTQVLWRVDVAFGDTTVIVRRQEASSDTLHVPTPRGTLPNVIGSFAMLELFTRQARRGGKDSASVFHLWLPNGIAFERWVKLRGADSAAIGFISGEADAQIDSHGRILRLDGARSTYQAKVARLPSIDLAALARGFVAQDSSGRALGNLSPPDSAQATIGSVSVRVNYGRPKRRGRQIMGGVVPWNTEWRTGANDPTTLELSGPLRIGDVLAGAGSYELTTLPAPSGVTLILRRKGADEREAAIRVSMRTEALATLVEDFTIRLVPADEAVRIEMSWEWMRWVVTLADPQRSRRRATINGPRLES